MDARLKWCMDKLVVVPVGQWSRRWPPSSDSHGLLHHFTHRYLIQKDYNCHRWNTYKSLAGLNCSRGLEAVDSSTTSKGLKPSAVLWILQGRVKVSCI